MKKNKKKNRRKGLHQQGLKTKNRKCVVYVTVQNEQRSQRQSLASHLHMTNFCFSFDFSFGRAPYVGSPLLFSSQVKLYVNARDRTFHIMLYTAKKKKKKTCNNGKKTAESEIIIKWDFSAQKRRACDNMPCKKGTFWSKEWLWARSSTCRVQSYWPCSALPSNWALHLVKYTKLHKQHRSCTSSHTSGYSIDREICIILTKCKIRQTNWNPPEYNKRCRCINVPNKYFFYKIILQPQHGLKDMQQGPLVKV